MVATDQWSATLFRGKEMLLRGDRAGVTCEMRQRGSFPLCTVVLWEYEGLVGE